MNYLIEAIRCGKKHSMEIIEATHSQAVKSFDVCKQLMEADFDMLLPETIGYKTDFNLRAIESK